MKKVSRQRAWQLRQMELGNCIICGQTAALSVRRSAKTARGAYCATHRALQNQYRKNRYSLRKAAAEAQ